MSNQICGTELEAFTVFSAPMLHMEVTHVWRGYGSSLFLEMGKLTSKVRRDGTPGNPMGEMEVMIEYSWRIEDENQILGGSWSDENTWPILFGRLLGTRVSAVSLFARLPEVQLRFSNGLYLCSLMTTDGDPDWAILDRRNGEVTSVEVRKGKLHFEKSKLAKGST